MEQKIHTSIFSTGRRLPDKVCLQIEENGAWTKITYKELEQQVLACKETLEKLGTQPGSRIIVLTEAHPYAAVLYLAILAADATAILLDYKLAPTTLSNLVTFCDADYVFVANNLLPDLAPILSNMSSQHFTDLPFYSLFIDSNHDPVIARDPQLASIIFSSGTTGQYKGVMLSHDNMIAALNAVKEFGLISQSDCVVTLLPLYHVFPLIQSLLNPLSAGAENTFITKLEGEYILKIFQKVRPTVLAVVPRIIELFANGINERVRVLKKTNVFIRLAIGALVKLANFARGHGFKKLNRYLFYSIQKFYGGRLKKIVCGGAALNQHLQETMETFGFTIYVGYGLTETTGGFCTNRPYWSKPGTVGLPLSCMHIAIDKNDDSGEGEILLNGPLVAKGYFRDEGQTNEAIRNGWLYTGDIGHLDKDGFLTITGRKKEIIITSSGKKAIPSDVENHYQDIEGVIELAVFGMMGVNQTGEQIHAAVVLSQSLQKDTKNNPELDRSIKSRIENIIYQRAKELPVHQRIQHIHFVDALPKTSMLKVQRTLLRDVVKKGKTKTEPAVGNNGSNVADDDTPKIETWLREWVSVKLHLPLHEVDKESHFLQFGLDSLHIIQLCDDVQKHLQKKMEPTLVLEYFSIEKLASYLSVLKDVDASVEINEKQFECKQFALSATENHLWELLQVDADNPAYQLPIVLQLNGLLEIDKLNEAFQLVIKRHDALRSTYQVNGAVYKQILDNCHWRPIIENACHLTGHEFQLKLRERLGLFINTRFDYSNPPLWRVCLVQRRADQWVLIIVISHLIADGWSTPILLHELLENYHALADNKSPPYVHPKQYRYQHFVNAQLDLLNEDTNAGVLQFWENQVRNWQESLLKHDDLAKNNEEQVGVVSFVIGQEELDKIKSYCQTHLHTLYAAFLSAWQKTLCEYFQHEFISLKLLSANRDKQEFRPVVGFLANGLLFNQHVPHHEDIHQLMNKTRDRLRDMQRYQAFPFEWLYKLGTGSDKHRSCKLVFNWHNYVSAISTNDQLMIRQLTDVMPLNSMWGDGTELSCNLYPEMHLINGSIRYRTHLFSRTTIETLVDNYIHQLKVLGLGIGIN